MLLYLTVAAQEGPGIVIAHPGQDVELLCALRLLYGTHTTVWIIDHNFYGVNALNGGILPGYSADLISKNLIVQNIVMNDRRNNTEHRCAIAIFGTTIVNISDPTFLYVAGEWLFAKHCDMFTSTYTYIAT